MCMCVCVYVFGLMQKKGVLELCQLLLEWSLCFTLGGIRRSSDPYLDREPD